jgi:two-component system phosphate regulon response regulator PhoB
MIAEIPSEWRLPGCGVDCAPRRHSATAHEAHGFHLALMAQRAAPRTMVRTGPMVVDLEGCRVTVHGETVALTPREWGIVAFLASRAGQLCANDDIVLDVWGREYLNPRYYIGQNGHQWRADHHLINTNLARIRAKLGDAGALIVTVAGIGRRLELVETVP